MYNGGTADPEVLASSLGHKDASVTMQIYATPFHEAKMEAAARYNQLMQQLRGLTD